MKLFINIMILSLVLHGCTYERKSPQAIFHFDNTQENSIKARRLLYEIAINNNLLFTDGSRNFPSGTSTTMVTAKRTDSLELILSGVSESKKLNLAVHCHKKCKNWEKMYHETLSEFSKHWKITKQ